jgi:hypothetical protein
LSLKDKRVIADFESISQRNRSMLNRILIQAVAFFLVYFVTALIGEEVASSLFFHLILLTGTVAVVFHTVKEDLPYEREAVKEFKPGENMKEGKTLRSWWLPYSSGEMVYGMGLAAYFTISLNFTGAWFEGLTMIVFVVLGPYIIIGACARAIAILIMR